MEIEVNLFLTFRDFLPPGSAGNPLRITVKEGLTVDEIAEALNVPPGVETVIIVNGRYREGGYTLQDGDKVSIFPPINGG